MSVLTTLLTLLAALTAGAIVPLQGGANAALGRALGHPLLATTASLMVSLLVMIPLLLMMRVPVPAFSAALAGPWWLWTGGLAGVFYLTAALTLSPLMGASMFMAAVIAGQMVLSLLMDQYGWMGFPLRPVSGLRLLAVGLVIAGVVVLYIANTTER